MKSTAYFIGILYACLCLSPQLTAELALYLEPNTQNDPYMIIEADASAIQEQSEPVDSPILAAEGWRYTEYSNTFKGYVSQASVGANNQIAEGTAVHLTPEAGSLILTFVEPGDQLRLLYVGDWAQVEFTKRIELFFNTHSPTHQPGQGSNAPATPSPTMSAPPPPPSVPPLQQQQPASTLPDVPPPANSRSLDDQSTHNLSTSTAAWEAEIDPVTNESTSRTGTLTPQATQTDIFERPKDYEGKLTLTSRSTYKRSGYSLELRSLNGNRRVAFVDMANAPASPLEDYLDQIVIIHGLMEPHSKNPKQMILHARTMRRP